MQTPRRGDSPGATCLVSCPCPAASPAFTDLQGYFSGEAPVLLPGLGTLGDILPGSSGKSDGDAGSGRR